MPVFLFTFHGRGTWMPDHARGYVRRKQGLRPRDERMAAAYRRHQQAPAVRFDTQAQRTIVDAARAAGRCLDAVVRAVTCDATHVHVVVSWRHGRDWRAMRRSLRTALSRALNAGHGKRDWFAEYPSRKRIRDTEHLDYLVLAYLPRHRATMRRDEATVRQSEQRDAARPVRVTARRRRTKKPGQSKPR